MVRGQMRTLPRVEEIAPSLKASIHNRFDIEVVDATTGKVKQKAVAHNIILNSLWAFFAANASKATSWATYIHYGSGTATPLAEDTSLTSFIGSMSAAQSAVKWDPATGVYQRQISCTLSETTAVGKTISEVGIANNSGASYLLTKALLRDMNGNQVSIAKTSTDIIRIYATVFVHVNPNGYKNGTIKVLGKAGFGMLSMLAGYSYGSNDESRMPKKLCVPNTDARIEGKSTALSGAYDYCDITWSFNATTKTFKTNTVRIAADKGNNSKGISAIGLYNSSNYNYVDIVCIVDEGGWYAGSDVIGESLGTGNGSTVDFATKFGYISNPTVYVDGVEVTDVTFDINEPVDPKNNYFGQLIPVDSSGKPVCQIPNGTALDYNQGAGVIYENPNYETIGIVSFRGYYHEIHGGNDPGNLTYLVYTANGSYKNLAVGSGNQNYRYYKVSEFKNTSVVSGATSTLTRTKNVHFATPPAEGAIITIDYHTNTIAKDTNHVFDFSVEIQLGEYVEE